MSNDLSFKRKFFILKKEYSNMRNVNPKGHGKLELRNNRFNLSINIENGESNNYYNVILLGDNKIKDLGKVHTDKSYGGKADFDFNYKDLESLGFPLEKINGILILRDSNILLGGYLEKDDMTIQNYINRLTRIDTKQQKKEVVEEPVPQGNGSPVASNVSEVGQEEVLFVPEESPPIYEQEAVETILWDEPTVVETFAEGVMEKNIFEEPVIEEQYIVNDIEGEKVTYIDESQSEDHVYIENDIAEVDREAAQVVQENRPSVSLTEEEYDKVMQEMFYDPEALSKVDEPEYISVDAQKKQNQKNQTTNYVLNILSFFPYIEPFKIDLMGYNWWRIDIDDPREDKGFLPYFSYVAGGNHKYPLVQNTVTATALMRKHGHYLFGLYNSNNEVKFYVYGVPGEFTSWDHPQKGTTGFNTWFEGRHGIGYWLLYIDPSTGRVIYPINPMIPKD